MPFNENSRVKIPALIHLTRQGYTYISLKGQKIDPTTNIFIDIFHQSLNKINETYYNRDSAILIMEFLSQSLLSGKLISEIKESLEPDNLGETFYRYLQEGIPVEGIPDKIKLIDFKNPQNNSFHVVTELTYKNGEDEFRPDITLLINGMPLVFIEVKKPNNTEGIIAEHRRMEARSTNKKFRKFINITQIMVFSNNMEYDDNDTEPIQGAYYASCNYHKIFFNHFREDDTEFLKKELPKNAEAIEFILKDANLVSIKDTPEFITNSKPDTPTHRMLTSLFTHSRFLFLLQYGIAYVEKRDKDGLSTLEKHIMRYPQFFASKAIERTIDKTLKTNAAPAKGVIWHTQGSGKTALAYYSVKYLKDFFQQHEKIARFYFIVDRLDLLTQASNEFAARRLHVEQVNSKDDFIKNIKTIGSADNTGEDTITVVNIQKFSEESIARQADYNVQIQRVYFLDEAHRSYNPKGSFLSNLMASDRNAIIIALTGTPLIGKTEEKPGKPSVSYNTKNVFGDYIHKYYYNLSIADGYTLKLLREGIETSYRTKLREVLDSLDTEKGSLNKKEVYAHPKYVKTLTEYIVEDFNKTRTRLLDDTIGAMIVCDSSEQARRIFSELQKFPKLTKALILHDEDDKDTRHAEQDDFKKNKLDILVVFNMLLTGFDAPRLKKLYMVRIVREHNLLQALTRVNRPYKNFHYGYVVDFADIREEFDKTNKAYFNELQEELGDEFKNYQQMFLNQEEIENALIAIKNKLFSYPTDNLEQFSQTISEIDSKQELIDLRQVLSTYKELFNIAKLQGFEELTGKFDLDQIAKLYSEVDRHIQLLTLKENLSNGEDNSAILNLALDTIEFQFKKISEEELIIADKFRSSMERARFELHRSLDPKDHEYITLFEELKRVLAKKNIEEFTASEMNTAIEELEQIRKKAIAKNAKDSVLCSKYENDPKFMRVHKRLKETPPPPADDISLNKLLLFIKHEADTIILNNQNILNNEDYFMQNLQPLIIKSCKEEAVKVNLEIIKNISLLISNEYLSERRWAS
ncbi:type I restriction endonuclease subunit R [Treponema primitia]|uniref:type I restriction endonuclease subunit R n=1 Tax=Treponema primitia TaxID=88058 RepID=UPI00025550A9|nr:type I restriction endonuclease [Treponema primitia]